MATKNFYINDGLKVKGDTLLNGSSYSDSALSKLHVKTAANGAGANLNNVDGLIIENSSSSASNYALKLATGTGNILSVTNSGNVGIGTVAPNNPLDVVGYIKSSIGFKAGNYTILNEAGNETSFGNSAYYGVSFKTNNATRMKITNAGNVGIGTTDPNEKLTVSGNISASGIIYADAFNSKTGGTTIDFNDDVDLNGNLTFSSSSDILIPDNAGAALEIKEGSNVYQRFITTNGGEKIELYKNTHTSGGFTANSLSATSLSGAAGAGVTTGATIALGGDLGGSVALDTLGGTKTLTATIQANSVALATDTTGNYVQSLALNTTTPSLTGSSLAAAEGNTITGLGLSATGVTANSYGSTTVIPVITVLEDGRISNVSTSSIPTDLTIAADSGSNDTVTIGTDTLTFAGTSNEVDTTVSNNQIQIGLPSAVSVATSLSTPLVLAGDGSVSAPSYSFTGDTNTGMWRPGSDQLRFNTGGVDRLCLTSSLATFTNSVCINDNITVAGNLTVHGSCTTLNTTVTATSAFRVDNDGTGPALVANQTGSQPIADFQDDGTSVFYIEDGGNVGLGTTNPEAGLHIFGSGQQSLFVGSSNGACALLELDGASNGDGSGGDYAYLAHNADGSFDIKNLQNNSTNFATGSAGTTKMTITSGGNVGIGTESPGYKLEVSADTNSTVNLLRLRNADATYSQTWDFQSDTNKDLVITGGSATGGVKMLPGSRGLVLQNTGNDVKFTLDRTDARTYSLYTESNGSLRIKDEDASTDRISILSGGNVGIGNTNPNKKLSVTGEVSGTSHATFDSIIRSNNQLRVSADYSINYFYKADNTTMLGYLLMRDDNNSFLSFPAGQDFRILHGNTSRIAVASAGNVGIGTTDPNEELTVVGDISASGNIYGNIADLEFTGLTVTGDLSVAGDSTFAAVTASTICNTGDITVTGDVEADEFIGDLRGAVSFTAKAGEALSKGDVVYISGISGTKTVVAKADADDTSKMPAFGVTSETVNLNANVTIYTFGTLSNVDTSLYPEGTELFVSTTAGGVLSAAPTGESAQIQKIAKVTRQHGSSGSIKIMGAGRSNATPNLNEGRLFVGNSSNQAVADGTIHVDIANSKVGIGTNSPNYKLDVNAGLSSGGGINYPVRVGHGSMATNGDGVGILFNRGSAEQYNGYIRIQSTQSNPDYLNPRLEFGIQDTNSFNLADASTRMVITGAGNVGIGTTSPIGKLHIYKSDGSLNYLEANPSTEDAFLGNIYGRWNGSNVGLISFRSGSDTTNKDNGDIAFYTSTAGGSVVRAMTIDENQKVGIGVTSPSEKLSIASGDISLTTGYGIHAVNGGNENGMFFHASTAGNSGNLLNFKTDGSERMRIDSSGNVGIGITSPAARLQVNQAASDQSGAAAIKVIGTAYGTNKTIHACMGTTSNTKSLFYAENSNGVIMNIAGDGNTSIGGNILPSTDNTRDLGSSSKRWANVYANSTTTGAVIESNLCTNGLDSCPEGSVVIWRDGKLQGTTDAYSHRVMGVTAPGSESPIVMGAENILVTGDIEEGDTIVTSNKYNHGMRGSRSEDLHGKVIAEALESGSGESYIIKGMIRKF